MANGKIDPAYQRLQQDVVKAGGLESNVRKIVKEKMEKFPNQFPALKNYENKLLIARVNEIVVWLRDIGASEEQYTPDIGRRIVYFWNPPGISGGHNYLRWELRDWFFYHDKPADHGDFFFGWIRMNIPGEKVKLLRDISSSIVYYPLGRELGAGCHVRGALVATLSIVKMYVTDHITFSEAQNMYDRLVARLVTEEVQNGLHVNSDGTTSTPLTDAYEKYLLAESDHFQETELAPDSITGGGIGSPTTSALEDLGHDGSMKLGSEKIVFSGLKTISHKSSSPNKSPTLNKFSNKFTKNSKTKKQLTTSIRPLSTRNISHNFSYDAPSLSDTFVTGTPTKTTKTIKTTSNIKPLKANNHLKLEKMCGCNKNRNKGSLSIDRNINKMCGCNKGSKDTINDPNVLKSHGSNTLNISSTLNTTTLTTLMTPLGIPGGQTFKYVPAKITSSFSEGNEQKVLFSSKKKSALKSVLKSDSVKVSSKLRRVKKVEFSENSTFSDGKFITVKITKSE